jgi:methylisocitrate lyase
MNCPPSPGTVFRDAVNKEKPLQVVGTVTAYSARLAERAGFKALYVSGGGVSASSLGAPDLGISTLDDVITDVRRITNITDLPVLADIDTGWDIPKTIRSMINAGAAAVHIEDQVEAKRCGHLSGKTLVSKDEMVDRVRAAVDAKTDPDFVIMARTDALAVEGLEAAIDRARAYVEAGADMIFPEAMTELAMYKKFAEAVKVPLLANITEFGATPLYTVEELAESNVSIVLYPLSAFRAMSRAAVSVYKTIRRDGTQKGAVDIMQTRKELYDYLDYEKYEDELNNNISGEGEK